MCRFLSAIAWSDGKIFCAPEYTDSHSDLIAAKGLDDSRPLATRGWVRVEFTAPSGKMADQDAYTLTIDESSTPAWLDDAMRFQIAETLRDKVRVMIVADHRSILLGGCWILVDGATIDVAQCAAIKIMLGSSNVGTMRGSSKVGEMLGSSNVGTMLDSSNVGTMLDSSNVGTMLDSSKVGEMLDSSNVGTMLGSSNVGTMRGSSKVGEMLGSSKVGTMLDSSNVGTMLDSSKVGTMLDSSKVGTMWDSSKVGTMWGSSNVGTMRGSSKVGVDSRTNKS